MNLCTPPFTAQNTSLLIVPAALYAEHPWILAHFAERAQTEVWNDGPDVPVCMSVGAYGTAIAVHGFPMVG